MTREEAIEFGNMWLEVNEDSKNSNTYAFFQMATKALKQESIAKNVAQERYQDLIDYFGGKEIAKTILEDRIEFKKWLERIRWHVKRADELARELERLKKLRAEIAELDKKVCQQFLIEDVDKEVHRAYQDCLNIIDKYSLEVKK